MRSFTSAVINMFLCMLNTPAAITTLCSFSLLALTTKVSFSSTVGLILLRWFVLVHRGDERAEPKGEACDLPVDLRSDPHLWL